ncbi:MAG: hypothetical protein MN733_25260 [Nitrososphaera sp.]|nr:hypothetical protein [Nitrososphaera sp.]
MISEKPQDFDSDHPSTIRQVIDGIVVFFFSSGLIAWIAGICYLVRWYLL